MSKLINNLVRPQGAVAKLLIFMIISLIFILGSIGHLDAVIDILDSEALTFHFSKKTSISAYKVIKSIFIIGVLFWATAVISDYIDKSIRHLKNVKPSNRAILSKTAQIIVYFIGFLTLMDLLEIDLKTLTVFSGAVGIGVGFGLQKITSNFISGLILLFEKSVRVDDLIELDNGVFGFLRYTGARYTLVEAVDGREILIPNEDFITSKVTNWTYSHKKARVEIPVGVAYNSDLEKVQSIMLETASAHPKCMMDPKPQCFLRKFSDHSIDFVLYFWVMDIIDGRMQPQSEVMLEIWRKFKENSIEISYPQREVYVKNLGDIINSRSKEDKDGR